MGNSIKFNRAQRRAAKKMDISNIKFDLKNPVRDPAGKIPIFSPALALLLCSVHGQEITDGVVSSNGEIGLGFVKNQVVVNALSKWDTVVDSFEENEMPVHELLCRYLRLNAGRKNCKLLKMLEADYISRVPQPSTESS